MSNYENHPCFKEPVNKDIKVWRYMDFTKYVSLLDSCSLYFSRLDFFEDIYEGSIPIKNHAIRKLQSQNENFTYDYEKQISNLTNSFRKWVYVNCWHVNELESEAMWKLYSSTNNSIVIQSTYSKLISSIQEKFYAGLINYINYQEDVFQEGNMFWPILHKRLSFSHENELRLVIDKTPRSTPDGDEWETVDYNEENPETGKIVKVNLNKLVENIYVSPNSDAWFIDLIQKITDKYDYDFRIRKSDLLEPPIF